MGDGGVLPANRLREDLETAIQRAAKTGVTQREFSVVVPEHYGHDAGCAVELLGLGLGLGSGSGSGLGLGLCG